MGRKQKQKQRSSKRRTVKLARSADKHDLYERAVQEPDADIPLIQKVFRNQFSRPARTLR
jgi:hypothetical protein